MSEQADDHAAVFSDTLVYFIFCFGTKDRISVRQVAQRLLEGEIAETVVSPVGSEVRVAQRYRVLADLVKSAEALRSLAQLTSRAELLRWARRHPRWALGIFWRIAVAKLHIGRQMAEPSTTTGGTGPEEEAVDEGGVSEDMTRTVEMIRDSVAHQQVVSAVQNAMQAQLLRPEYLAGEPFLRLQLRGTTQWWSVLDGGAKRDDDTAELEGISVDALLLLHRSGVMQLTIAAALPLDLSTEELVRHIHAGATALFASEIPEPLIRAAASGEPESRWLGEWRTEVAAGTRWRYMSFENGSSVAELFSLYRDAIERAADLSLDGEWFCYPVVCVDRLGCCSTEEQWRANHSPELAGVVARFFAYEQLRPDKVEVLVAQDHSLVRDHSVFLNAGSATRLIWHDGGPQHFDDHLWTLLMVESALLQNWQLRSLDSRLARTRLGRRHLRDVQDEAIYGLAEYRRSQLLFGTADDAVSSLLRSWRLDRLYERIRESLEHVQQRAANDDARRASRRADVVAGAAAATALVLGLPAIKQSLDIAESIDQTGPFGALVWPLHSLAERGANGVWLAYVTLIAGVALAVLASLIRRPRRRTERIGQPPGDSWPFGTIQVVARETEGAALDDSTSGDDEDSSQKPPPPHPAIKPPSTQGDALQ